MGFSTIDDPSVVGPVYLKLGNRIRKVESVRKTFGGILHGFEVAYGVVSAGAKARHGDLRLRVPQGAWLTEFDPEVDLGPEAVVEWCLASARVLAEAETAALAKYEDLLRKKREKLVQNGNDRHTEGASTSAGDQPGSLARLHSLTSGALDRSRLSAYPEIRGVIVGKIHRVIPPWRQRLDSFLNDPSSSIVAQAWTLFILSLIFLSTVTFCLESLPFFTITARSKDSSWFVMEATAIAIFTVEIILQVVALGSFRLFLSSPMNVVDLAAVLPFYLETIAEAVASSASIPSLQVLRVIRLVRVFRLFKASRGSLSVMVETMFRSSKPLYMLFFLSWMGLVIFSSVVYYAEKGDFDETLQAYKVRTGYNCVVSAGTGDPFVPLDSEYVARTHPSCSLIGTDPVDASQGQLLCTGEYEITDAEHCSPVYALSKFNSIPAALWWCVVTMVTVGYGDVYPLTPAGKIIAGVVMIFGVLVLAMPISVIGANFTHIYSMSIARERKKKRGRADKEMGAAMAKAVKRLTDSGLDTEVAKKEWEYGREG